MGGGGGGKNDFLEKRTLPGPLEAEPTVWEVHDGWWILFRWIVVVDWY